MRIQSSIVVENCLRSGMRGKMNWKKEAVGYQIYPRSFRDTNGDGIGDLPGILSKLDYLKELGIDVIWICPVYPSPNDDNGYDISDYQDIMTEFGTMDDFKRLLHEAHERGMKLIMDLVINHTSDEHPWFIESKSSKDSPKRDWYIWRTGKAGKEPNNWESIFGGSAWKYDEKTGEYYLHIFSEKQPDLNWESKEVRMALYQMIHWWMKLGVDGFRIDAISHIKKQPGLEDMPNPNGLPYVPSFDKHMNQEGIHEFLKELREEVFSQYDMMTVGEANGVKAEDAHLWVGEKEGKFDMIFHFEHLNLWDTEGEKGLDLVNFKKTLSRWQNALDKTGWNALFIENHDVPRAVSKWGEEVRYWKESAKALGLMYFMQKGTPFIYQGQEIGMTNAAFDSICSYRDKSTIKRYEQSVEAGLAKEQALKKVWITTRDNARTPMQWNNHAGAGFTEGIPWMGINPNYSFINVESQLEDPDSVLNFYKAMIELRKEHSTLIYGKYELELEEDAQIYAYTRKDEKGKYLVVCNLSSQEAVYTGQYDLTREKIVLSNYKGRSEQILLPYEARLYQIVES